MRTSGTLAQKSICDTAQRVGRKMEFPDKCVAPFPAQTFARIASALHGEEDRTTFIREAVERELKRRGK